MDRNKIMNLSLFLVLIEVRAQKRELLDKIGQFDFLSNVFIPEKKTEFIRIP